ncbi:hypothetical protein ACSBR1_009832 [Camellia fascicularis]
MTKEEAANRELLTVANDARAGGPAEGAHLHIVHLSDARSSLDLIKQKVVIAMIAQLLDLEHYHIKSRCTGPQDGGYKCWPPDRGLVSLGKFTTASMFSKRLASVMRIVNVMQASTHDYQFIILPLLKSFMQELFEVLVDKDTKKKADAAREALLSEIELEAKKKKNFESKKKNKNQRKNKDPKVTQGDDLYVPQEETEEQVHFPVSYNGDYPSSVIVVAARADELGLQEEELKHEIEHDVEERKLEEKLEYQRQIAEEDKHTNLAKQNKHAVASIAEEVEEMDVASSTDLGPGLRNVGENNCFINVIVQSLWHLRTFRGKFLRRSTPAHAHIKDPCIVCELHGIFTALREAKEGDDAVSPTTLRIAQSKWQDVFDLSIAILSWESLEEPAHKISATLGALSTKIDIGVIYEGLDPGNTHYLISMVCYGLEHYICFVYNRAKESWILYDDDKVKVIGSWDGVLAMCLRKHLQPQLLFFEVKGSVSTTPSEETKRHHEHIRTVMSQRVPSKLSLSWVSLVPKSGPTWDVYCRFEADMKKDSSDNNSNRLQSVRRKISITIVVTAILLHICFKPTIDIPSQP